MKSLKPISISLAVIILVILIIQNLDVLTKNEVFRINLLFATFQSPPFQLYLLLLVCFVAGFLFAYLSGFIQRRRLKKTIKTLSHSQRQAEKELDALRNLPIVESRTPAGNNQSSEQDEE